RARPPVQRGRCRTRYSALVPYATLFRSIRGYMEHCARKYGLYPHIRFGTEVESARFDETHGVWEIRTKNGETLSADVLVSAVGQDRKSTRLNSSHVKISYAVFCSKKKNP